MYLDIHYMVIHGRCDSNVPGPISPACVVNNRPQSPSERICCRLFAVGIPTDNSLLPNFSSTFRRWLNHNSRQHRQQVWHTYRAVTYKELETLSPP